MAVERYRKFEIRTDLDCDKNTPEKISKRYPAQVTDPNGYHWRYVHSVDEAKRRIDAAYYFGEVKQ